jgi:putative membrane protein
MSLVHSVFELGLLLSVLLSAGVGAIVGFAAGLVPGLHMNNVAATLTAYAGGAVGLFALLGNGLRPDAAALAVSCFVSAALVAHLFAGAVTSAYVGIPSEDVVSVLPAHRLAKAGFGGIAVTASADGSLAGVLVSVILLGPICMLMGQPIGLYEFVHRAVALFIIFFSIVLLTSEGLPFRTRASHVDQLLRILKAVAVFLSAGVLGTIVLRTDYYACPLPDLPWMPGGYVMRSSLLLPLFAGLFGLPGLLLSLGSRSVADVKSTGITAHHSPSPRDLITTLFGGFIVGWMPGMTSGSAVTLCSPFTKEAGGSGDISGSVRFIWLYSAISSSGAVFAVGALFTILRARSGSMDAVQFFLGADNISKGYSSNVLPMVSIVLAMILAALLSHSALRLLGPRLARLRDVLCSRSLALCSMAFVCVLSLALTGTRGAILVATATTLGLIPPLVGIRRIQLMGCLLVPIAVMFLI